MTLGLKRGIVSLVPHQKEWALEFENESARLKSLLGGTSAAIEHVGSTAVPDLVAKPIIDVAIAVVSWNSISAWPALLAREGYTYFGDRENVGDHFFAKGPDERRTHHVHVVIAGGAKWNEYLKFRDTLRSNPALREEYQQLKRYLAEQNPNDREAYTDAKASFIKKVLALGESAIGSTATRS